MSTAHSLKIENKPMLFSYDIEIKKKLLLNGFSIIEDILDVILKLRQKYF